MEWHANRQCRHRDHGELRPFTPEPVWDVTDSLTVLYAVNDAYRISFYGRDGAVQRKMPPPFQPRLFHEDEIYGVWRDELDVQYVVRLHVSRGDG